jgi:uncharacterized membrane protein YphA (DoxX/SURF4 family)
MAYWHIVMPTGETSLATTRYQIGLLAAVAIVALRVGIGLHFYLEGAAKLRDPKPFSAGFLGNAKGPLAPAYKRMVWDADGLYRLNYDHTYAQWDAFRNRVAAHYQFDQSQAARGSAIFNEYLRRYVYLLDVKKEDLNQYYAELKRRDGNAGDPSRALTSFQAHDARIAQERAQLAQPVLAAIDKMWNDLETNLNALATQEQYQRHGRVYIGKVGRRPLDSEFVDSVIPYFDMVVGACLILGLFTRPAAIAGGLFLASVCLSQWPLAPGAAPIYAQAIEMLALFFLAAVGAGQYAGLDFILSSLWRISRSPRPAPQRGVAFR